MSTRSRIAIKNNDNTYTSVYCHLDGHPSYNGKILVENYKTKTKVVELIKNGDLSSLGENIGSKQNFNKPEANTCVFYGRDRGESDVDAFESSTLLNLFKDANDCWAEYLYIFEDGEWNCYDVNSKKKLK